MGKKSRWKGKMQRMKECRMPEMRWGVREGGEEKERLAIRRGVIQSDRTHFYDSFFFHKYIHTSTMYTHAHRDERLTCKMVQ